MGGSSSKVEFTLAEKIKIHRIVEEAYKEGNEDPMRFTAGLTSPILWFNALFVCIYTKGTPLYKICHKMPGFSRSFSSGGRHRPLFLVVNFLGMGVGHSMSSDEYVADKYATPAVKKLGFGDVSSMQQTMIRHEINNLLRSGVLTEADLAKTDHDPPMPSLDSKDVDVEGKIRLETTATFTQDNLTYTEYQRWNDIEACRTGKD